MIKNDRGLDEPGLEEQCLADPGRAAVTIVGIRREEDGEETSVFCFVFVGILFAVYVRVSVLKSGTGRSAYTTSSSRIRILAFLTSNLYDPGRALLLRTR